MVLVECENEGEGGREVNDGAANEIERCKEGCGCGLTVEDMID